MTSKFVRAAALLFPGLLAGAFQYGAVNVLYAFRAVPLDVRFTFHTALMRVNGPVMQTLMALSILSTLIFAARTRSRHRLIAGIACALEVITFIITRFGNVPINQKIKVWAVSGPPSDYAAVLHRWELFHFARTGTAILAFVLLVTILAGFITNTAEPLPDDRPTANHEPACATQI
ncbi:anthrone oxygenase family protein [Nocardia sp. NPDC101769]|uniref:anthrone oxygenase family protein n=1 Tax=Nocardia sp. NPDC101769 TaxID=3364333 RepID=UPI0037FF0194